MAISQSEFKALDPTKHKIVDCRGKVWAVEGTSGEGVVLVSPGKSAGTFRWIEGNITDEFGIDVTINHPLAHVSLL